MPKSKKSQKPHPATTISAPHSDVFISRFDSDHHPQFLAVVSQGVDSQRLKIWNIDNSTVTAEIAPQGKEKITSLNWGLFSIESNNKPIKKKKSKTASNDKALGIGLSNGHVQIYSVGHSKIIQELKGVHVGPITDFVFHGDKGFSSSEDGWVVSWNLKTSEVVGKFKLPDKSVPQLLAFSSDMTRLVVASTALFIFSLESEDFPLLSQFSGHAAKITSVSFTADGKYLLSASNEERFLNVYDITSDSPNIIPSLSMDHNVMEVRTNQNNHVAALGEDGVLSLWVSPTGDNIFASKQNKKKKFTTRSADEHVKFLDEKFKDDAENQRILPILTSSFVFGGGSTSQLVVARGSWVKPVFEKLDYAQADDSSKLLPNLTLYRAKQASLLVNSETSQDDKLKNAKTPLNENNASLLGAIDFTLPEQSLSTEVTKSLSEPSMGDKLATLNPPTTAPSTPKSSDVDSPISSSKIVIPDANSLHVLLVQAIHSSDKALLESCLQHSTSFATIRTTVQKVPTNYVIPLMNSLMDKFHKKPTRGSHLLEWIKAIVTIHSGYLMTIPDLVKKLSMFYQSIEQRLNGYEKMLKLKGRLELVLNQIDLRQPSDKSSIKPPLIEVRENDTVGIDEEMEDESEDDESEEESETYMNGMTDESDDEDISEEGSSIGSDDDDDVELLDGFDDEEMDD